MPSFRTLLQNHRNASTYAEVAEYKSTSIELDGFEVTIGKVADHRLNPRELQFTEAIRKRAAQTAEQRRNGEPETVDTPFAAHFNPRMLVEFHESTTDAGFRAMCERGIDLLSAQPGGISHAARRVADAADTLLQTPGARDPLLKEFALNVRLRARETLERRIKEMTATSGKTLRSDEFVALQRTRAMAMAEHFGVHDATQTLGVHVILDAHGNPAYAFKAMTEAAPRAVCQSRLHAALARAMDTARSHSPLLPGMIVRMPFGSRHDAENVGQTLGLLMPAPPDFTLCLDHPDEDADVVRERLARASAGPTSHESFEHVALTALSTGRILPGDAGPRLDGVLVDDAGRAWVLDHDGSLATRAAGDDSSMTRRPPGDLPMRIDRLRGLAELMDPDHDPTKFWRPTSRERRLLAEALGKTSAEDVAALDGLWPSPDDLERLVRRVRDVGAWAAHCVGLHDQGLADDDQEDFVARQGLLSQHASIQWCLDTIDREAAADRPGGRARDATKT